MQTFLPFPDFRQSASVLDRSRLGKQRVECKQILSCLLGIGSEGWKHHPCTKMWRGHEQSLAEYMRVICEEWISRGYRDSCLPWLESIYSSIPQTPTPPWLGNEEFHASHRAALLWKARNQLHKGVPLWESWYSGFGWKEEPVYDYIWPVVKENEK